MPETHAVRFPMACPACSAVSAMPTIAVAQAADGVSTVSMRCKRCNHEWRLEMPPEADPTHMRSGVRLPIAKPPKEES